MEWIFAHMGDAGAHVQPHWLFLGGGGFRYNRGDNGPGKLGRHGKGGQPSRWLALTLNACLCDCV
jgi:hypothetical protein